MPYDYDSDAVHSARKAALESERVPKLVTDGGWAEAFCVSNPPEWVGPPATANTEPVNIEAITVVLASSPGENDGPDWVGLFVLADGRYAGIVAGCDYTGWDCQAGGRVYVAACPEDIIRRGFGEAERARLGGACR